MVSGGALAQAQPDKPAAAPAGGEMKPAPQREITVVQGPGQSTVKEDARHCREHLSAEVVVAPPAATESALRELRYELTVEDPEYLTSPATYTAMWDHRPDLTPGAACDPKNSERFREE